MRAELNWHVLGVAAGLSLLTGVLFGLAPALQATRVDVMPALKETRAGQQAARRSPWRISLSHALVVGQIAISLLMLVAAGLFVRTLSNLESVELGFNRENCCCSSWTRGRPDTKTRRSPLFIRDLRNRLCAIPGVRSATLERDSLIAGEHGLPIGVSGAAPNPANRYLTVGPAFFTNDADSDSGWPGFRRYATGPARQPLR